MVVRKRKKSSRQYGTHGWGANKHRNSGMRGGYGNAGTGKKSDNKKPSIWATDYFGKHGFVSRQKKTVVIITLRDVEDKIPNWLADKKIQQDGGAFTINLEEMGYTKLLSTGKVTKKIKITIPEASAGCQEKIKAAGGELVVAQ